MPFASGLFFVDSRPAEDFGWSKNNVLLAMNQPSRVSVLCFTLLLTCLSSFAGELMGTARLWCESLRLGRGTFEGGTLDISTLPGVPNGEFAPYDSATLVSGFSLDFAGLPITGTIWVDLPPFADANNNGFDDFFETGQGVSGTSQGAYETPVSTGAVTASWNRETGSKDGRCVLSIVDNIYGRLGDFSHIFEIIEYAGPIYYSPGATNVTVRATLARSAASEETLSGRFQLLKSGTNRFNELALQAGALTNQELAALAFAPAALVRDVRWPTNYYSYLDFIDGNPGTAARDYPFWTLSLDDPNDTNGNGIPDLSDDVAVARPTLGLSLSSGQLRLEVSGAPGWLHEIQHSFSLRTDSWQAVQSVQVTNDPQVITFPLPSTNEFWRVLLR